MATPEDVIASAAADIRDARDGDRFDWVGGVCRAIAAVAGRVRVQQHPLGFFHYELTPLVPEVGARVRFHLWTPKTRSGSDDLGSIHDHTWRLSSAVLVGSLVDVNLEPRLADDGPFTVLISDYEQGVLRAGEGRFRLKESRRRRVEAGEVYTVAAGIAHKTDVEQLPTATLLVAEEMGASEAHIYSSAQSIEYRPARRDVVSRQDAEAEVRFLLGEAAGGVG